MDETDVGTAYKNLLESRKKDWKREVISELGVFFGGGISSFGTALYLQVEPTYLDGYKPFLTLNQFASILLVAGLALVFISVCFRHWSKSN